MQPTPPQNTEAQPADAAAAAAPSAEALAGVELQFVCTEAAIWPELRNGGMGPIAPLALAARSNHLHDNWVLRTCLHLRRAGVTAGVGPVPRPEAINIVSGHDIGRRMRLNDAFLVVGQGDAHWSALADFHILQNRLHRPGRRRAPMWHWPQSGLVPRDPSRGTRLERVSYKGVVGNLDAAFRDPAFAEALAQRGVELDLDMVTWPEAGHRWHDYSDCDAVLAVRNLTRHDASKKPASKLVNAWMTGVPAILGPEPAFRELRQSPLDYLEVRSPAEALAAVERLKADPELYRRMVENGRSRAAAFTEAQLTQLWIATLAGPVLTAFRRWQRRPAPLRRATALLQILIEPLIRRHDRYSVLNGPRILETAT